MKTSATKLIVLVSMSAVALAAGTAAACPKGGYGGGYNSYNTVYVKKVYVQPVYTCYRPLHCFAFVLPGDTWATISQREYGSVNFCPQIASFNRIGLGTQLFVGQQIRLPEIHPNGGLTASNAPA
ncbi:MAG TPA: LysM peptidoglycan-binding domain-containing protein, partial [Terriglobales bacterium]